MRAFGSISRRFAIATTFAIGAFAIAPSAHAQMRSQPAGPGGGRPGGGGATQSGPVQNKTVGPTNAGGPADDDDDGQHTPLRAEPQLQLPQDPLAMPEDARKRIGSDDPGHYTPPVGETQRTFYGLYYAEQKGDYRLRLAPPFYIDHTRGIGTTVTRSDGTTVSGEDQESLYGGIYYRRRSPNFDADVLFPLAWRLRDGDSKIYAFGPIAHRDAPGAHDNWLAPLVFEGERPDGGYFHSPLLLTSSHWNKEGAFTVVGPYFRNRTGGDVDLGVAPFYFHGDNQSDDGVHKTYTLIPPLFFYRRDREIDDNHLTVVGPVLRETGPKKDYLDVFPLFFSNRGKPEGGGKREWSTTLVPFFHVSETEERKQLIIPGYFHREKKDSETTITPFYSHATTRNGSTDLTAIGPVFPMYWKYTDRDTTYGSFGLFPFYWHGQGPANTGLWTPLFAKFETYGVSRTYWAFPNLTVQKDTTGWETDLHPLVYLGRDQTSSHTVFAPLFWDFDNKKSRTTIAVPAFVRYADYTDESITQVAGNTLYMEKRVAGGKDWQFHFLPVFSYGENPSGYFWNLFFGLAGYTRDGAVGTVRAFWYPIQTDGPPPRNASNPSSGKN